MGAAVVAVEASRSGGGERVGGGHRRRSPLVLAIRASPTCFLHATPNLCLISRLHATAGTASPRLSGVLAACVATCLRLIDAQPPDFATGTVSPQLSGFLVACVATGLCLITRVAAHPLALADQRRYRFPPGNSTANRSPALLCTATGLCLDGRLRTATESTAAPLVLLRATIDISIYKRLPLTLVVHSVASVWDSSPSQATKPGHQQARTAPAATHGRDCRLQGERKRLPPPNLNLTSPARSPPP
uniref:Uncharacterized protein n=1 Tax=Oryza punctata TaxID=4537 RepID=A0A0E0KEJ8_ORYPU